jgi:hypothetical protein
MSRIHVMQRNSVSTPPNTTEHRCLVHVSMPSGTNLVGILWSDVFLGSGVAGFTRMREGVKQDEITTAEKASILAGTIIELEMDLLVDNSGNVVVIRDGVFDQAVAAKISEVQARLQQYGRRVM